MLACKMGYEYKYPPKIVDLRFERMINNKKLLLQVLLLLFCLPVFGQKNQGHYILQFHNAGKDTLFNEAIEGLQNYFLSESDAIIYIAKIPSLLAAKGYPSASVDSTWNADSASTGIMLYTGQKFKWVNLAPVNIEPNALEAAGYNQQWFLGNRFNIDQLQSLREKLLSFYDNNGHPFASVFMDSIQLGDNTMQALLKADKGILYHVDSLRNLGKLKISKKFLQNFLLISNGSIYSKAKLAQVDKRLMELPYLIVSQPSSVSMLGSGSILNLFLEPRRSNQVDVLIGLLPATGQTGKMQVTADVNLNLKNQLLFGETFLLKWQQLQPKSPRLNLGFDQPFLFNSPFGLNFLFDLYKRDSNFIQVSAQLGTSYFLGLNQTGKLFVQWQNNSLLEGAIDTNLIKAEKKLPPNIDVRSVNAGLSYEWQHLNYKFNPRKGNEINITSAIGIKNIRKSNEILSIKDPAYHYAGLYDSIKLRSYQIRIKADLAHFFPMGKSATLKAGLKTGLYSSPSLFRNELFLLGGYKLMRGFNEESIYASWYNVFTAEYRYLTGLNSYLYIFADQGFVKNKYQLQNNNTRFTGVGLGMSYETKAGLLNVSFAIGNRSDQKFNLRSASKIHFGYINYF